MVHRCGRTARAGSGYHADFERINGAGRRQRLFAFGRLARGHVRCKVARHNRYGYVGIARSRLDGGDLLQLMMRLLMVL